MKLTFEIQGVEKAVEYIEGGYYRCYVAAAKEMAKQMLLLREYAVHNTMHGPTGAQTVRHVSGNLANNTTHMTKEVGETIIGRVGILLGNNTAPYARILHEGGTTRAHVIQAQEGKSLAFQYGGQTIYRKLVHHPGSKFPPRPYLAAALEARKAAIVAGLRAAMEAALRTG